ncbi:MAG TPA: YSC84-related protein [Burkholderiales bacterium]|nr:YSC84-related protein [Burkholderiales bacterium]
MNMRILLAACTSAAVLSLLSSLGCTTTGGQSADPEARRQSIDATVDQALSRLEQEVPASRDMISSAQGVLVFPSVLTGGFVVGGTTGQGALRKSGKTAGYFSITAVSVGLLIGAQSKSVFILFMTQDALDRFAASNGWTAGVDGSVALINRGASAAIDTRTGQRPIVGYVLTNGGLMANLSLDGTRIARLDL